MSVVLLVEDEEHLALGMRYNLENAGYEVRLARSGEAALAEIKRAPVDLVVLDVVLPGRLSGHDVARAIRHEGNIVPILMVSAREQVEERIRGLDAGADDYLPKPFELDELLARARGLLRRQVWHRRRSSAEGSEEEPPAPPGEAGTLEFGKGCRVDFRTCRAIDHQGREVQLTWKEAMTMRLLAEHEGEVIPRARFLEEVWGEPGTLETRTIDNFILRLRKHFERDPRRPQHILSVRGMGYRFVR